MIAIEMTPRTELEELKDMYCDCYKDVHGIKARWIYGMDVSLEEMKEMLARLEKEYQEHAEQARQWAAKAEADARKEIQALIDHGARNVVRAVRWLHEAHDTGGDNRFLDFELGCEYGFIDSILKNGL